MYKTQYCRPSGRLAGGPRTYGGRMSELQQFPTLPSQPFRLAVPLHELLQQPAHKPSPDPSPLTNPKTLPQAGFPHYPELFHDLHDPDIAATVTFYHTGSRRWP